MALLPGIPGFTEVRETAEEAIGLLRRAVAALEKLAAEQERANDLYADVNEVAAVPVRNLTER
jgi:predicted RNase H-like HicB family nuclease